MSEITEYNQPTLAPVPKVAAVGVAGALVALIVGGLAVFGVILPDGMSGQLEGAVAAIITLVSVMQAIIQFLAGYLKKDEKPPQAVKIIQMEAAESQANTNGPADLRG